MSSSGLDLNLRRPLWHGMHSALVLLAKWKARIWHRIEALPVHYIDAPSLDGMRWCDEVERKISQSVLGERNWLDTYPHGSNKRIGR